MLSDRDIIVLVCFTASAVLVFLNYRVIVEAIENFKNHFPGGGPPTATHPSPADDGVLLRRKRSKPSTT